VLTKVVGACSENQITPFTLATADGESLYAWHILPLPLYSRHEDELSAQVSEHSTNIEESLNFKLLSEDPDARLLIYCKFLFVLKMEAVLIQY
jgi:hypothetical protein